MELTGEVRYQNSVCTDVALCADNPLCCQLPSPSRATFRIEPLQKHLEEFMGLGYTCVVWNSEGLNQN